MLLTRLFKFIVRENPKLENESYVLYDRVMNPLAAQLERKPRRDRGTKRGRHSTSSYSTFDLPSSSHLNDDDDDGNDEGTSRASTPSPIHVLPRPLNPKPLQSHPSLDITLSLSPITPLDHIHDTSSPPSQPQPQPPIMGHPLVHNYNDYQGQLCIYLVSSDLISYSPEPTISCFDDLDFFKDFENEFPAIVYNDAQTSKLDFLTEPTLSPQHIDEFDLKSETLLSECDEKEQNVLNFNDLFPFNDLVKEMSTNIGGEFTNLEDLEVLDS
ncbi:hypothetical protein Tco_0252688 [Tanacetum coccineum]